jgi:hypothetical protein
MKLWKVDYKAWTVRQVEGNPWPAKDSEGETCFENTHFATEGEAWDMLFTNASAIVRSAGNAVQQAKKALDAAHRESGEAAHAFMLVHEQMRALGFPKALEKVAA